MRHEPVNTDSHRKKLYAIDLGHDIFEWEPKNTVDKARLERRPEGFQT